MLQIQGTLTTILPDYAKNNFTLVCTDRKSAKSHFQKLCSKKNLQKRLPIIEWLPKYNTSSALNDLIAGITVAMTILPQGLAYATIVGVPPQNGLYSSFMGCFIYIIFGTCKDVSFGPSAISSLLISDIVKDKQLDYIILLCFLVGIIQILMGLLGLGKVQHAINLNREGFLIDFISGPVYSGFISSAAIIVVTSQIKNLLGIAATDSSFIATWKDIAKNISHTNIWDLVLGIISIGTLLALKALGNIKISEKRKVLRKILWLVSCSRNALLVLVGSVLSYNLINEDGKSTFTLIGKVAKGLPSLQLPPFSHQDYQNGTLIKSENFGQIVSNLNSGIIVVALLSLLEDLGVCHFFSNGKSVNANQEFIALGLCNLANSFVQSFAGSGAFSRSAVNHFSSVKTPLGNLYTGVLVILSILYLTPYFYYIPKSALAAIIIAAIIFMVEVKVIKPMWKVKKTDLVLGVLTFIVCLLMPLQYGMLIGIGINLLFILYQAARPKITVEKIQSLVGEHFLLLQPDRCLIFPSVNYVKRCILKYSLKEQIPVVLDCSHIYGADFTAISAIKNLIQDFSRREQPLFFYNLRTRLGFMIDELVTKDFYAFYDMEKIDELLEKWCTEKGKTRY